MARTITGKPFPTGATMFMAGYQDVKFVAYPIDRPRADGMQTDQLDRRTDRRPMPGRENWNKEGRQGRFPRQVRRLELRWLDVPRLIRGAEQVFEFPLVDRDPLPAWSFGATTLLGDAAHPMYPIGSNGASQGILDGRADPRAGGHADPVAALQAYEAERLSATADIVVANQCNRPEECMQIAEERAPQGFGDVSQDFADGELEAIAAGTRQSPGSRKRRWRRRRRAFRPRSTGEFALAQVLSGDIAISNS